MQRQQHHGMFEAFFPIVHNIIDKNLLHPGESFRHFARLFLASARRMYLGQSVTFDLQTNLVEFIYARISVCEFWWQAETMRVYYEFVCFDI